MKKALKFLLVIAAIIAVVIIGAATYVSTALPDVGQAPEMKVKITPEKVERGRYLAHNVSMCVDCHSRRDSSRFAMPIIGKKFAGSGLDFTREHGFPGDYYAPNLTPAHLGNWTDGELYRAITMGVSKDGSALFNVMPYRHYAEMAKSDVKAIIAYLRTLEPVERMVPESQPDFLLNFLINTMPKTPNHKKIPLETNAREYGRYIVNAAACTDCHTPRNGGKLDMERAYAGGQRFPLKGGIVRSANLTPAQSGLAHMSEKAFISRFRQHGDSASAYKTGEHAFNTVMPWHAYAGMKKRDLAAIYSYLQSLAPIENKVERFQPMVKVQAGH